MIFKKQIACKSCEYTEPEQKTVFPTFDENKLDEEFIEFQKTLRQTYDFKRIIKSKLDLLSSYNYSDTESKVATEQRQEILKNLNQIESYLIDIVIHLYIEKQA
jgi:hypothetical protein